MPTLDQLSALAEAVPEINNRAAKQAQARNSVQAQQQASTASGDSIRSSVGLGGDERARGTVAGESSLRLAQGMAPGAVAGQAQPVLQAGAETQQTEGQIAGTALQATGAAGQADLAAQSQAQQSELAAQDQAQRLAASRSDIVMRKKVTASEQASAARLQSMGIETDAKLQIATIRQRDQLNRLGGDVKDQLVDARMRFERDDMGRKFTDERQLADWVTANAKTDQQAQDSLREMQQTQQRKVQILEAAQKAVMVSMQQGFTANQSQLDNDQRYKLATLASNLRAKIARETADIRNKYGIYSAAGGLIGGVAGAFVGGPAGAVVGSSVGSAVGGMVANNASSSEIKDAEAEGN